MRSVAPPEPAAERVRPTQRVVRSLCPAEGECRPDDEETRRRGNSSDAEDFPLPLSRRGECRRPNPSAVGVRRSRRPEGGSVRRPDDEETRRPPQDEKSVPAPRTSDAEGRIILRQGSLSRAASKKEIKIINFFLTFILRCI